MTSISKQQLGWWALLFTVGAALLAWPLSEFAGIGIGLMATSNVILMPKKERSRNLARRELGQILLVLLVFAGLVIVANLWLPKDVSADSARVIRHPAFVMPLWAVSLLVVARRVSRDKVKPGTPQGSPGDHPDTAKS